MNESDAQSVSDTTSDFPSILRDKLELSADFDFVDGPISPTSKKTIAELMGLTSSPIAPVEIDVEQSKNVLMLKLMSMQPGYLDEIIEERSEEIDLTEMDKTECSLLLLRKNDSVDTLMLRNKFLAELRLDRATCGAEDKTKSTVTGDRSGIKHDAKLLNGDLVGAIKQFQAFEDAGQFCLLNDLNNISESFSRSGFFGADKEDVFKTDKEDAVFADQIERFKKKRKPLEVDAAEKEPKLNELQFSNIRRVNLNFEQPICYSSSNTTTKLPDSGTNSTNFLVTETNSLNPETSQQESESCSLFSRSLLKPNDVFQSIDKIEEQIADETQQPNEVTKSARMVKFKEAEGSFTKLPDQLLSQRVRQQEGLGRSKQDKMSKSEKKLPFFTNHNFSLLARHIKKETRTSQLNSSLPFESNPLLNVEQSGSNTATERLHTKLSAKSKRVLNNLTQMYIKSTYKYKEETSLSFNENFNSQNNRSAHFDNQQTNGATSNNINSKLKKFLMSSQLPLQSKVAVQSKKMDFDSTLHEKFYSTLKPRLDHSKATSKPKVTTYKTTFLNSYEKSIELRKKSHCVLNSSAQHKRIDREKLSSKRDASPKERLEKLLGESKFCSGKPIARPRHKEYGLATARDLGSNNYIKRNKEELEKQRDGKYTINRTLASNSKIFSKAKEMLKRG